MHAKFIWIRYKIGLESCLNPHSIIMEREKMGLKMLLSKVRVKEVNNIFFYT